VADEVKHHDDVWMQRKAAFAPDLAAAVQAISQSYGLRIMGFVSEFSLPEKSSIPIIRLVVDRLRRWICFLSRSGLGVDGRFCWHIPVSSVENRVRVWTGLRHVQGFRPGSAGEMRWSW